MRRVSRRAFLIIGVLGVLAVTALAVGVGLAARGLLPGVYNIEALLRKGPEYKMRGYKFTVLAETSRASVQLYQVDFLTPHYHPNENHFLYIIRGRGKGHIGAEKIEVGPGDFLVIPAGKSNHHSLEKIGAEPLVILEFSTPPFRQYDVVWGRW
jgi:mannose-6-phosphate isomerase-like protein (cupin superfamily)